MNPITCGMAADLLPLYLDGCCSADSCAALEAHMDACPACRAQYAQLRRGLTPAAPAAEDPGTDGIARALARKMRRRKRCLRSPASARGPSSSSSSPAARPSASMPTSSSWRSATGRTRPTRTSWLRPLTRLLSSVTRPRPALWPTPRRPPMKSAFTSDPSPMREALCVSRSVPAGMLLFCQP